MSCTIKKDFQYNRVMPTFHHWKTGSLKYGQSSSSSSRDAGHSSAGEHINSDEDYQKQRFMDIESINRQQTRIF